jgi:hypothetical protein
VLALAGESAGILYVGDHLVLYSGARLAAMGHNGKTIQSALDQP